MIKVNNKVRVYEKGGKGHEVVGDWIYMDVESTDKEQFVRLRILENLMWW